MPEIPCTVANFSPPRRDRTVDVTPQQLMWAAACVGVSPTVPSLGRRPLLELCWRIAMVASSLTATPYGWEKSSAYNRLDGSEKNAVSYFLGMTQAQLMCSEVLGIPWLVHLDHVLTVLGRPIQRSRPDFLGIDPFTMSHAVAIEAKGRTHGKSQAALVRAKAQAQSLPSIDGVTFVLSVASLSYFARHQLGPTHVWKCHLDDPPREVGTDDLGVPRELILALHYRPLASAIRSARTERHGRYTRAALPEMNAWLWAPTELVDVMAYADSAEGMGDLVSVGAEIAAIVRESADWRISGDQPDFLGKNAIGVELGPRNESLPYPRR